MQHKGPGLYSQLVVSEGGELEQVRSRDSTFATIKKQQKPNQTKQLKNKQKQRLKLVWQPTFVIPGFTVLNQRTASKFKGQPTLHNEALTPKTKN